jgi:hypothetical protein
LERFLQVLVSHYLLHMCEYVLRLIKLCESISEARDLARATKAK